MVPETALIVAALALGVSSGLLVHEWAHAAVLHLGGVAYTVTILPDRDGHPIRWLARTPWAVVTPRPSTTAPVWVLQIGALAPLALAVPVFGLALLGFTPEIERPVVSAFALGWLACAIPSPQDFSVVFHAHRLLGSTHTTRADDVPTPEPAGDPP